MEKFINKIICADSRKILKNFPDGAVDLLLTDPPYGGGDNCWAKRKRGRFGGNFNKYYIGGPNGRNMGGEVRPPRGRQRRCRDYALGRRANTR